MLPEVVITNRVHDDVIEVLKTQCRVTGNLSKDPWSHDELTHRAMNATGIMAFMPDRIDEKTLTACPNLGIIACVLKGYDNFDVQACTRHGVWLTFVPDRLTMATAEFTIGLMISISRNIVCGDRHTRENFKGWRGLFCGQGINSSTVGILGMGAIGQAVAKMLCGFDCEILYYDERPISKARSADLKVRFSDLANLLQRADFLVLALPLTSKSTHLLDSRTVPLMKSGCFLINTARGSLVDEEAVADALESGKLGGYAADVFEMEDWARLDRPKTISDRLIKNRTATILTPHIGSADFRARYAAEMDAAHSILDYIAGHHPRGAINNLSLKSRRAC